MLAYVPIILALVGIAVTVRLVHCFASCPEQAMKDTSHDPSQFALVMAGRYGFMGFMLLGAIVFGDATLIAFVFAGLSALGLFDVFVYGRARMKTDKHALAASLCAVAAVISLGAGAASAETGRSDFVYSSDLASAGFVPFPASGVARAIYGMKKDTDMYLCFVADTIHNSNERQTVLLAELDGQNPDRSVPNIPVVCILTQ